MPKKDILLGIEPKGVGGDVNRTANIKVNSNFNELYKAMGAMLNEVNSGDDGAVLPSYLPIEKGGTGNNTGHAVSADTAESANYATTAGKLGTPVQINGVDFDGSQSINIAVSGGYADTAGKLASPVQIHGVNFDGSAGFDIPNFTATKSGVVPAAGSDTTKYLRSDGTWQVPTNTTYALLTTANAEGGTATTANTISAKVLKEAIQYHAPTVTNIAGNAGTATKLATPVQINGVDFDGSQSINIAVSGGGGSASYADTAGKLASPVQIHGVNFDGSAGFDIPNFTATKSGVVPAAGSDTTKYLRSDGTWQVPTNTTYALLTTANAEGGTATTANTISAKVLKEAIQYHAPTVTNIAGNAGTATKLQTARTISLTGDVTGSVSFDGSSDVSITTTINGTSGTPGEDGSNVDNSGLIILIKDSLRQSIEVASGGEQTVLYTAKGQPTYMNIIKKFDMSSIDASLSGTHPAFIVDGVEKPEIFIGTYQGKIVSGELLSLPNVEYTHSTNYDNFLNAARASGNGHHLITNAEWSAVALQCFKDNKQPMGNTYYGRSSENPLLVGRRVDGLNPGDTSGTGRTLTGSGPVEWRHNGKENGIADLSGNVSEWNSGLRIFNGEIQVIADNNAANHTIDLGATSSQWKAINGETGNLVTPDGAGTTVGTIKYANGGTADYTINGYSFGGIRNLSTTKPVTAVALARLKALCLYPLVEDTALFNNDSFAKAMTDERLPIRGGYWYHAANAGVFYLHLGNVRSSTSAIIGSRPAFVNL